MQGLTRTLAAGQASGLVAVERVRTRAAGLAPGSAAARSSHPSDVVTVREGGAVSSAASVRGGRLRAIVHAFRRGGGGCVTAPMPLSHPAREALRTDGLHVLVRQLLVCEDLTLEAEPPGLEVSLIFRLEKALVPVT